MFPTIDASAGYLKIETNEDDDEKTAIMSQHDVYRYTRMLFGLEKPSRNFHTAIDMVFSSFKWQCAIVYIYDIIIFSHNVKDDIEHIRLVLKLPQGAGISL